jgi:hypothetical protein
MAAFEEGQDVAVRGVLTARQRFDARGQFVLSGQLEVSLAGTRQDDYAPTGIDTATGFNTIVSADTTITGVLATGSVPRVLYINNRSINTKNVTLSARDPNSTSSNWFTIAGNIVLKPGEGAVFIWAPTTGSDSPGWRCVGRYFNDATLVTVGGMTVTVGVPENGIAAMPVGTAARNWAIGSFQFTSWEAAGDVLGAGSLRIYKQTYAGFDNVTWTDMSGASLAAGGKPFIAGGTNKNTSSDLSLWPVTTISDGDMLRAVLDDNTGGHRAIQLYLKGIRTVTRA